MPSLERLYTSQVRSGFSLLFEDIIPPNAGTPTPTPEIPNADPNAEPPSNDEDDGLVVVPDEEFLKFAGIPREYAQFFVPGSGRASPQNGEYGGGSYSQYMLKFPMNAWSDGTEDIEATYDYVENQINSELYNSGDNPGGEYSHSRAKVDEDGSTPEFITVRVYTRSGMDV